MGKLSWVSFVWYLSSALHFYILVNLFVRILECRETPTDFLIFCKHKKAASRVGYFNKISEFSFLPKTARSAQKQKVTRLI